MKPQLKDVSLPVVREGQPPPMDLDAEAATLSSILLEGSLLDSIGDLLGSPGMFYSEAHQQIYGAILDLRDVGSPIDVVTVASRIKQNGTMDRVGGMGYLTELLDAAPAISNIRAYATTVREKWRLRELAYTCDRIRAEAYCSSYVDTQSFFESVGERISMLTQTPETTTVEGAKPVVMRVFDRLKDMAGGGGPRTLKTGFSRVDAITGGIGAGELMVIAARPGMGKSALVLSMLLNIAAEADRDGYGQGALLFSLEMPKEQIARRALCSQAKVELSKVKNGTVSQSDWNKLTTAASVIAASPISFDDQAAQTVSQLSAKVRQVRAQMAARKTPAKLRVVAVDYLQLLRATSAASKNNRQEVVAEIARGLKALAMNESVAVIALSQLNRDVEKRIDKRPTMSDLRESGEIENAADNIGFVYRDDYYAKQKWRGDGHYPSNGETEINFAKLRDGDTGMVKLKFCDIYTRFEDLEDY